MQTEAEQVGFADARISEVLRRIANEKGNYIHFSLTTLSITVWTHQMVQQFANIVHFQNNGRVEEPEKGPSLYAVLCLLFACSVEFLLEGRNDRGSGRVIHGSCLIALPFHCECTYYYSQFHFHCFCLCISDHSTTPILIESAHSPPLHQSIPLSTSFPFKQLIPQPYHSSITALILITQHSFPSPLPSPLLERSFVKK